ncbi:WD40 repeat [Kalmanozyma brasiliensis GHG001]|uniref:U3 small nucleolar RNA-associated protein 13 C-terminal domain-containing protein n=1 Tax=Kalmanozyma brasiliensis (strain GHG001) TaxID=1365824 RepID=V5ETI3_KALBG|nr:WD40 repeat [Kalmanozyma brasiliensis GHG001]EST08550.1 WD40 repeat [Kalmanozyma brasiliensis GHG001]
MADAQVLTPDQIQQILAAQQQQASASSSSAPAPAVPSQHRLKTSFKKRRAFEPFYTGGATALTPDGSLLFATLNEQVTVVEVTTGNVVQRIEGDTEEVTSLAVTPSGSHLVVASRSLALRIYSLPECKLVRSIPKSHLSQVNLMDVDPTSTLLATGGSDGVAKVWDIEGGFCTHAFKGHAGVVSALAWNLPPSTSASSPAKKNKNKSKAPQNARTIQLLTGSVDGKVRVWDLNNPSETHKPIATLAGHDSVVRGIAVTEDGNTIVTGSRDRTLVVWRLPVAKSGAPAAAWKQAETLSANEGVESVGFLPSGSFGSSKREPQQNVFWTGGSDGQLRLWDVSSSSIIAKEPKGFNEQLVQHAKQDRAKRAMAAGRSAADVADADEEETRAITAVHLVSPDDSTPCLVSVHADQNIVVRSVGGDDAAPLKKVRQLIGFNDEIVDLALLSTSAADATEEESHLAVATNSRSLRVYTLGAEDETSVELLAGHTDIVLCVDKSPDMRLLASGAKDRTTRIWAWVPKSRLSSLADAENGADDAGKKVSRSNGHFSSVAEDDNEGEWVCVGVCEGHAESVGAIAFARRPSAPGAPGAPFIVTASQDRTVKLWDLSPINTLLASTRPLGQPIALKSLVTQRVHEKDINCLDISPNNAMLATGSQDRTAKIFSLSFTPPSASNKTASARLTTLATLKGHKRGIWACRFSSSDLALATASGDKTIRLWSLKTFSSVKLFEGHTNSVLKLAFLSNGMQLASCAGDGLVKVWNIKEEECATTIDAHDDKVWSIAVAKSEAWLVSAAADGGVRVWEDRTEEEKEEKRQEREEEVRMEQEFGNMLTRKDWKNAIHLALQMGQPRRLLGLFTHVGNNRPEVVEQNGKRNGLLASVLATADSDDDDDDLMKFGDDDGDAALQAAGIRRRRGGKASAQVNGTSAPSASDADANSITGLASIDSIISTLPPPLLIQLLIYIRDWNTSTRTSPVAQTLLHAILSTHTAASLLSIFAESTKSHRAALASRLEDEELGITAAVSDKEKARQRRLDKERNVDLGTLVEGLLPYTERQWARADRTLIEASMLEYSVEAMDTLIGFDDEDMQEEGKEETFGEQIDMEEDSDADEDEDMSDSS